MNKTVKPRPDMQLVDGNVLPVWASCIVWATSCSKLNMFNIVQLVARCDFLLLKQATCCVDKLLILSRHATCCRQQVACLDGLLDALLDATETMTSINDNQPALHFNHILAQFSTAILKNVVGNRVPHLTAFGPRYAEIYRRCVYA